MDDIKPQDNQDDNQDKGTSIPVSTSAGSVITPSEPTSPEPTVIAPESITPPEEVAPSVSNDIISAPVSESAPEPTFTDSAPEVVPTVEATPSPVSQSEIAAPAPEVAVEPPTDPVMPGLENEADKPPTDAPVSPLPSAESLAAVPSAATAVKKKGGNKGVIVIVAIVVGILISVGYFAFMRSDSTTEDNAAPEESAVIEPGDSETPDSASTAIDESLKDLDDTKDFNSTDIDDTALGL